MNLKQRVFDNVPGGPIGRVVASRWLHSKSTREVAKLIREHAPRDAREQSQKVDAADGPAFIAPVCRLHFPAILKGWFERVFAYGSAYALTREGWEGHASGRVPLMHHGDRRLSADPGLPAPRPRARPRLRRPRAHAGPRWCERPGRSERSCRLRPSQPCRPNGCAGAA